MDRKDLQRIVADTVRDHLLLVGLVSVDVERDADSDGGPMLRVDVVFDKRRGRPDPERMLGLVWRVRESLEGTEDDRFPLVTY